MYIQRGDTAKEALAKVNRCPVGQDEARAAAQQVFPPIGPTQPIHPGVRGVELEGGHGKDWSPPRVIESLRK